MKWRYEIFPGGISKTKQTNKQTTGIFNKVLWYYLAAAAALW